MAVSKSNLAAIGLVIVVAAWLSAADKPQRTEPIDCTELNQRPVIGMLGQPLGTVATIEGDVVDGSTIRIKDLSGKPVLQVARVNGQPVESKPVLQFNWFRDRSTNVAPKIGNRFAYVAYEVGHFSGVPDESFKYVGTSASLGFRFRTELVLLRDENAARAPDRTPPGLKSGSPGPTTGQR